MSPTKQPDYRLSELSSLASMQELPPVPNLSSAHSSRVMDEQSSHSDPAGKRKHDQLEAVAAGITSHHDQDHSRSAKKGRTEAGSFDSASMPLPRDDQAQDGVRLTGPHDESFNNSNNSNGGRGASTDDELRRTRTPERSGSHIVAGGSGTEEGETGEPGAHEK